MVIQIKPFEWQKEALKSWEDNNCSGITVIPTSGGKTIFGILTMLSKRKSCLIVCNTEVLAQQWYDELKKFIDVDIEKTVGFYYSKHKDIKPITIALIQTLTREKDIEWDKYYKMIIVDEIHSYASFTYKKFLERNNFEYKLGLTATLERQDGEEDFLIQYMNGITYKLIEQDVKDMNLISKFKFINYGIILPENDIIEYNEYELKLKNYLDKIKELTGENHINPFQNIVNENIVVSTYKMHYRKEFAKQKNWMYSHYLKNKHAIKLIEQNKNKKILIFNELNSNAQILYDILESKKMNPLILNTTTKKKQKEIIDKFSTKDFNILIATKMVDEGFSINNIDIAILLAGNSTLKNIKQRIGRLIRKSDNEMKEFYQLYLVGTRDETYANKRENHINYADEIIDIIV